MKKTILIAAMLVSLHGLSQDSASKKSDAEPGFFQFGLKGGVNISNFTGGSFDKVDKKAKVGFHAGAYARLNIGSHFAIQPEALFSTQGATIDSSGTEYDWKTNYINIPIMAVYRFDAGIFIEAGLQFGFLISDDIENRSIEDQAKSGDFSVAAGLGYRSVQGWGLGGRYVAGISKVGDFDASTGIDPDFKNGVIQISVYIPIIK